MGILEAATPLIVICVRDRARAVPFYRDVLGLKFIREDRFAAIFEAGGTMLRVSTVADFVARHDAVNSVLRGAAHERVWTNTAFSASASKTH
jgi:catechol 2,3-dioxygenase-like lactoylglutathione lyase family enzyme